jgi:hypothetical protein
MRRVENRCCDCAAPGYPCRGAYCPNRNVEVHYCDKCGRELDNINISEINGDELCDDCFEKETEE